jgi:hypothetical protein
MPHGAQPRRSRVIADPGVRAWVVPGNVENWSLGIKSGIWGLRASREFVWARLEHDDLLFFYVILPVRGIVGMGRVVSKARGEEPLWPDEIRAKSVLYPLRFGIHVTRLLRPGTWATSGFPVAEFPMRITTMSLVEPKVADRLAGAIEASFPRHVGA